jgi:hypothetical protein
MTEHPVGGGDGHVPGEEVIPPATEEVHLPGSSYLPVVVAFGVTLALVGVVISFAIGVIVTVAATVRWIRETREEMAELPLEH